MPTVAAIGTVVSAGAGVASTISANKARKDAQRRADGLSNLNGASPGAVFGEPVNFDPPEYTPLEQEDPGFSDIVGRIIRGGQVNLGGASKLSAGVNEAISKATRSRIEGWDPGFMGALATLFRTRNETLQGHLPYEDALAITADRTRLANDLGMPGGSGPQIAADLGMKRLDLMTQTGPGLTAAITDIIGAVDPITRHTTPDRFLLTPAQGVPLAIQDRQFGATFNFDSQLTGAYLDAAADPRAAGMFNLSAWQAGFNGGAGSSGPSTAGAVGNAFSALGSINWGALFNGQGGAGGWVGNPQTPNPIYAYNGGPAYYYNGLTPSQIPKALPV